MKTTLALMLLCACAPLCAKAGDQAWTRVSGNSASELYIDQRDIKDEDEGRKAWTLRSYRRPQTAPDGKTYRSVKAQYAYACGERTATLLAQSYYPEAMGRGEAVGTFKYEQYDAEKILPGSVNESAFKRVCRKRPRR
ncbi:surface-adhesin E family protein [Pseudoduganella namucuonensis]|uniref:Surface-adhesin protein E-like domain-containing protein n=1 Tax=Pseudoduganella namucuonensis TaxID=1035707 RepID=A0A1I7LQT4_9BURK|nr:surface-adhesin E family protein [Pseudoduganella namucuonensis]SFV12056.1 hypothetical protein SAMN05216552_103551 [Pseudoduganella namucuonensis]